MKRMNILFKLIFIIIFTVALFTGCGSSEDSKSGASTVSLEPASKDYPNASLLVSTDSVKNSLGASGLVVIDARSNTAYTAGHIPGAINIVYSDYNKAWPLTGLKTAAELESQLRAAGITTDMTIVIYDDTTAAWGAAGRLFWMFEYLGCSNVRIINGGWDKWIADGKSTETTPNTLPASTFTASVKSDVLATKEHIMERITASDDTDSNSDLAIIDTRTEEEYIGWKLYGELREGNIPKSVNIPYSWYFDRNKNVLSYKDLKSMLEYRGVITTKEVITYCTAGIRSGYAYFILRLMGYTRAANYDASIMEWASASATAYPMDKLEKYQMIVNPAWIKDLIDGKNPDTYPGNGYVILELTSSNTQDRVAAYNAGHIPGARHLNIRSLNYEYPVEQYTLYNGKLLFDTDLSTLQTKIEDLGITKDTTVVLYEYFDAVWCARIAWVLLYAGVQDVRILNGAYKAWVDAGYETETGSIEPFHEYDLNSVFGATVPVHPEYRTFIDEVENVTLGNTTGVLGDTRTWGEFIGEINGYNDNPGDLGFIQKGRIPGAIWVHDWDWYIHFKDLEAYTNDEGDNRLRSYTEVRDMWYQAGLSPDVKTSYYCGGGYRSSLSFLYGYMMGWTVSNYDGSWYEWSFNEAGNSGSDIPGKAYERGYPDFPVTW